MSNYDPNSGLKIVIECIYIYIIVSEQELYTSNLEFIFKYLELNFEMSRRKCKKECFFLFVILTIFKKYKVFSKLAKLDRRKRRIVNLIAWTTFKWTATTNMPAIYRPCEILPTEIFAPFLPYTGNKGDEIWEGRYAAAATNEREY